MSADEVSLCVALELDGKPRLYFFDVRSFAGAKEEGFSDIKPFTEVKSQIRVSCCVILDYDTLLFIRCAVFLHPASAS